MKHKVLINYARWFEWAFGMVLMVVISVIVVLPILSERNRWIMIIGLIIYLVASLVRVFDDKQKRS